MAAPFIQQPNWQSSNWRALDRNNTHGSFFADSKKMPSPNGSTRYHQPRGSMTTNDNDSTPAYGWSHHPSRPGSVCASNRSGPLTRTSNHSTPRNSQPLSQSSASSLRHRNTSAESSTPLVHTNTTSYVFQNDFIPETFATPLHEYVRLGKLVQANGSPVRGGMNEGIFVVEVRRTKEILIEKRLSFTNPSQSRRARAEIDALTRLRHAGPHPHINLIHESFFPGMTSYTCLYLSFCEGGSLQEEIQRCSAANATIAEAFAWHVLAGVMSALAFCHHGVTTARSLDPPPTPWTALCHLDVKPDNIWLTARDRHATDLTRRGFPRVVLGDFGCALTQADLAAGSNLPRIHGTPGWLPPEACLSVHTPGRGRPATFGTPTDIWQAGATLQCLCRRILSPQTALPAPCGSPAYSPALNSLVASCLAREVGLRPTAVDGFFCVREEIGRRLRGGKKS